MHKNSEKRGNWAYIEKSLILVGSLIDGQWAVFFRYIGRWFNGVIAPLLRGKWF